MSDFDFQIKFVTGRGVRKSKISTEEWGQYYGEHIIIGFDPKETFSAHICVPEVTKIIVDWRGQEWSFGHSVAKGQPFLIFLHNNARSCGNYEAPRHGESSHVYARTVGVILLHDKTVYEVAFHKNGKAIPKMRNFLYVKYVDAKQ